MGWVWSLFAMQGAYDEIVHAYTIFAITLALSFLVYSSMLRILRDRANFCTASQLLVLGLRSMLYGKS
ncbi:MAG TPA: hypothetical protein V6C71_12555 [Coleofasciculaceae cyanobacterium]|jgi:hypothetical protein